jgi:hypothetical protein
VTKPKLPPEKALFIFLWHCTLLRGSYTSSSFIYLLRQDFIFVNCFARWFEIAYQACRVMSFFMISLLDMDFMVYCIGQLMSTHQLYSVELNYLIL